jgi:hypothetical protein
LRRAASGEERAWQMLRFLAEPLWRAYTTTYIEGSRLVHAWLTAGDGASGTTGRYRRLLREPILPADMLAEIARALPAADGAVGHDTCSR